MIAVVCSLLSVINHEKKTEGANNCYCVDVLFFVAFIVYTGCPNCMDWMLLTLVHLLKCLLPVVTIGIKESDTGLAAPSQWDLVSDKQMMQEEQPLQVIICFI